jgi:hypothetical protein
MQPAPSSRSSPRAAAGRMRSLTAHWDPAPGVWSLPGGYYYLTTIPLVLGRCAVTVPMMPRPAFLQLIELGQTLGAFVHRVSRRVMGLRK